MVRSSYTVSKWTMRNSHSKCQKYMDHSGRTLSAYAMELALWRANRGVDLITNGFGQFMAGGSHRRRCGCTGRSRSSRCCCCGLGTNSSIGGLRGRLRTRHRVDAMQQVGRVTLILYLRYRTSVVRVNEESISSRRIRKPNDELRPQRVVAVSEKPSHDLKRSLWSRLSGQA